jgi:leader peptidase (prepilin peptidase)/N-methyltransferase
MITATVPLALTVPIACIAGLFVGSFLNVVIYRAPRGLSVVSPRSFCPTCERQLRWWENVPVLSWLLLHGKCRTCHNPISARYPLVEAITAAIFGLVTWAWNGSIFSAAYCALAASFIGVSLIEYGGKRAPLAVAAVGVAIGELVIIAGGILHHEWRLLVGSLVGLAFALFVFALLRVNDPECKDPRGHGRTAIILVACWMGPLDAEAIVIGTLSWIAVFFLCTIAAWRLGRGRTRPAPIFACPLVTALGVASAVSLLVAR